MGKFVGVSVVLFVLAVAYVVFAQGPEMAALVAAFAAEPLLHKVSWAIIALVPLLMLPFAVWLWDRLVRQGQTAGALELRLAGVRQGVKELMKSQADVEADVQRLTRSDPEDAIAALKQRVSEAEHFAEVQRLRNEAKDLQSRVDEVRAQQEALKARLVPVLDTRRSIERLFAELDTRQKDIDRALTEVASGDDAVALDIRLKDLGEFVRESNTRCDQIEQASKTMATLSEVCAELELRTRPWIAADDGIIARLRVLDERRDTLSRGIESLQHTPEGALAERVAKLADDRAKLEDGIAHLDAQFHKLAGLRKDVATLFAALDRALDAIAVGHDGEGAADVEARVTELAHFIEEAQNQFDAIEGRVTAFTQLRTRLDDLQKRLVPLGSEETGVVKLIDELHDMRDRLIVKIRHIEGGAEGDLAARVKLFADSKRELEDRVSALADQFTKLSTIRRDITGLFEKLSDAVNASAN